MDKPIAKTVLRNMLQGRSDSSVLDCVTQEISMAGASMNQHSRNEMQTIARALDALLAKDSVAAIELLVRRLVGVHSAFRTGTWSVADVLDQNTPSLSWLGSSLNSHCAKISARMQSARAPGDASGTTAARTRDRDTKTFRASDYKKPVSTQQRGDHGAGSGQGAEKSAKPAGSIKK